MTRLIVLPPLLAIALVGFVGRGTENDRDVKVIKYPIPGSEDTVGEVETQEERKVLDDFYRSKVLDERAQAGRGNDVAAFGRSMADQAVRLSVRFGVGERLTKAQVLADLSSGHNHMDTLLHDHIRLVAFGKNTVVVSGRSMSANQYGGKGFKGPKIYEDVWVKLDGRWQLVEHFVADAPNGLTRGFE